MKNIRTLALLWCVALLMPCSVTLAATRLNDFAGQGKASGIYSPDEPVKVIFWDDVWTEDPSRVFMVPGGRLSRSNKVTAAPTVKTKPEDKPDTDQPVKPDIKPPMPHIPLVPAPKPEVKPQPKPVKPDIKPCPKPEPKVKPCVKPHHKPECKPHHKKDDHKCKPDARPEHKTKPECKPEKKDHPKCRPEKKDRPSCHPEAKPEHKDCTPKARPEGKHESTRPDHKPSCSNPDRHKSECSKPAKSGDKTGCKPAGLRGRPNGHGRSDGRQGGLCGKSSAGKTGHGQGTGKGAGHAGGRGHGGHGGGRR